MATDMRHGGTAEEPDAGPDLGLEWLIFWAMAQDPQARDHYFHANFGNVCGCGCRHQA